jgi:hypothetical protein
MILILYYHIRQRFVRVHASTRGVGFLSVKTKNIVASHKMHGRSFQKIRLSAPAVAERHGAVRIGSSCGEHLRHRARFKQISTQYFSVQSSNVTMMCMLDRA